MKKKILLVEDDPALRLGLEENFKAAGYAVFTAETGRDALSLARQRRPDALVLDLMLPDISGYEVCRELREQGMTMPIVMLTARQEVFDKLHGFEMGADDYVTKPFSIQELLARIKAVLARGPRTSALPAVYRFGDCRLDTETRILQKKAPAKKKRGKRAPDTESEEWVAVALTRTEFELLAYFCAHADKALTREQTLNDVWGTEYYGTQRSLDSFVAGLRAKIERDPAHPRHILTLHGVGYKFVL